MTSKDLRADYFGGSHDGSVLAGGFGWILFVVGSGWLLAGRVGVDFMDQCAGERITRIYTPSWLPIGPGLITRPPRVSRAAQCGNICTHQHAIADARFRSNCEPNVPGSNRSA